MRTDLVQVSQPPDTSPDRGEDHRELTTWQWIIALVAGVGSAAAGVIAVFQTENEVGSAALLTVAVYFLLAGVLRRFPRLKIGDNEIDPEARKMAQTALHHAVVAGSTAVAASSKAVEASSKADEASSTATRAGEDATDAKEGLAATTRATEAAPLGSSESLIALDPGMKSLADEYNRVRWTMPSGRERTKRMTAIVHSMIAGFDQAELPDVGVLLASEDRGLRLAGVAAAYAQPQADHIPSLVRTGVTEDKPFNEFWALLALEKSVIGNCDRLDAEHKQLLRARLAELPAGTDRARAIQRVLGACP